MPQLRYARVPEVISGLTPDQIARDVTNAFERIVEVLTTNVAAANLKAAQPKIKPAQRLRIEASGEYAAFEEMNQQFLEQEWGDGLLLVPPTPEKVERMLKGTTRDPSDVVTVLAPGNGLATVEKIAINAVMAGCEPSHLPILIATCLAYTGLGNRVRSMATSTSAHAPLMMINGPIARELGINSRQCALGPGLQSRHNIALGRALRLIMINIGNCRPGRMDMDTIGSARKFGMCVAENEEENPWEPYHVEKGYSKDESTVTLFATRDEIDVNDSGSWTPEGVLDSLSFFSAIPGGDYVVHSHGGEHCGYTHLLMFGPEHANICGKAGWPKRAVREYVYQQCRTSAKRLLHRHRNMPDTICHHWRWMLKLSDQELDQMFLPVMENASDIEIAVVGGPALKDLIYRCVAPPSTVAIIDRA